MSRFLCHVTHFRSFLRRLGHDRIAKFSKGALEGLSDTNPHETGPRVSTSVLNQLSRV